MEEQKNVGSGEIQALRDKKGRFLPGQSGHRAGGPRGPKNSIERLNKAIVKFQKREGVDFWEAVLTLGWRLAKEKGKTSLLERIADKLLPTRSVLEAQVSAVPVTQMGNVVLSDNAPLTFDVGESATGTAGTPQIESGQC